MAIWVTGDCHGETRKFTTAAFPEQKETTRDDVVVICGDFGFVWAKDEKAKGRGGWKDENAKLDWLAEKNLTFAFVDGNHENHARLAALPTARWNGGEVGVARPNVLWLKRGQVYEIQGAKAFAFGGALSHDTGHGILDPETDPRWKERAKLMERHGICDFRTKGVDWWPEESFESMRPEDAAAQKAAAEANLDAAGWKVDFVFTHELPASDAALLGHGAYAPNEHSKWLESIRARLTYKRWFAGHYHVDRQLDAKDAVLYDQIVRIR